MCPNLTLMCVDMICMHCTTAHCTVYTLHYMYFTKHYLTFVTFMTYLTYITFIHTYIHARIHKLHGCVAYIHAIPCCNMPYHTIHIMPCIHTHSYMLILYVKLLYTAYVGVSACLPTYLPIYLSTVFLSIYVSICLASRSICISTRDVRSKFIVGANIMVQQSGECVHSVFLFRVFSVFLCVPVFRF